jgi:hypothetical protein
VYPAVKVIVRSQGSNLCGFARIWAFSFPHSSTVQLLDSASGSVRNSYAIAAKDDNVGLEYSGHIVPKSKLLA